MRNDSCTICVPEIARLTERVGQLTQELQHVKGEIPSDKRIMEAHSAMLAEWLKRGNDPHFVYKQGHDERCYICVLWNAKVEAERRITELEAVTAWAFGQLRMWWRGEKRDTSDPEAALAELDRMEAAVLSTSKEKPGE